MTYVSAGFRSHHVGAYLGGHQHGISIQVSINLGKTFLGISSIRKIAVTWILVRVFAYLPSFYFQILDLIYWMFLIFDFDLFWMVWHWKPAIPLSVNLWWVLRQLKNNFGSPRESEPMASLVYVLLVTLDVFPIVRGLRPCCYDTHW